jgi:hypothetical protein
MRQFTHLIELCIKRFRIRVYLCLNVCYDSYYTMAHFRSSAIHAVLPWPHFYILYVLIWRPIRFTFLKLFHNSRKAICSILVLYEYFSFGFLLSAFNNMFKTWIISFIGLWSILHCSLISVLVLVGIPGRVLFFCSKSLIHSCRHLWEDYGLHNVWNSGIVYNFLPLFRMPNSFR